MWQRTIELNGLGASEVWQAMHEVLVGMVLLNRVSDAEVVSHGDMDAAEGG